MDSVRGGFVLLGLGDLIGEKGVHAAVLHALNTNCILIISMGRERIGVRQGFEDDASHW